MKLICIGDSLTYGYGVKKSEIWTSILKNKLRVEVINKGICGDTTSGLLSRLYRDVILNKATHAIVMGGTNDFLWQLPIEQVKSNIASIIFQLIHYKIVPIIGIPTPVDGYAAKKKWQFINSFDYINHALKVYGDWMRDFSSYYNFQVLDFYSLFYKDDGEIESQYYVDGLHLNKFGHEKMAEEININL